MVIRNIQVVGMHHYGRRELDRLATYHIELESNNRYDSYAVAVFDGPRKCGNLKRDCARAVYDILVENKAKSKYFPRPLEFTTIGLGRSRCAPSLSRLKMVTLPNCH